MKNVERTFKAREGHKKPEVREGRRADRRLVEFIFHTTA